jgi:hypothetical protein
MQRRRKVHNVHDAIAACKARAEKCRAAAVFCDPPDVSIQLGSALDALALLLENGGGCAGCRKGAYLTNADTRAKCHICAGTGLSPAVREALHNAGVL